MTHRVVYLIEEEMYEPALKVIESGEEDISRASWNGNTPLLCALAKVAEAAKAEDCTTTLPFDVLGALLDKGADPNIPDKLGNTPLTYALSRKLNASIIEALLVKKANPNTRGSNGDTPLTYAVVAYKEEERYGILMLLLRFGADPNITNVTDAEDLGPEDLELFMGYSDSIVLPDIMEDTPLSRAIMSTEKGVDGVLKLETVQILQDGGANPNFINSRYGRSALILSLCHSSPKVTIKLLDGKDTDPNAPDLFGTTPLHYALHYRAHPKVVDTLLIKGADPKVTNSNGETPLLFALDQGALLERMHSGAFLKVVRALLKHGADPKSPDVVSFFTDTGASLLDDYWMDAEPSGLMSSLTKETGAFPEVLELLRHVLRAGEFVCMKKTVLFSKHTDIHSAVNNPDVSSVIGAFLGLKAKEVANLVNLAPEADDSVIEAAFPKKPTMK